MRNLTAIRGSFFDFVDDPWKHVGHEEDSARFIPDGLLVIDDGKIESFGPYDEIHTKHSGISITDMKERLILPGFVDGHIHVPQTRVLGAFGQQLLPWLQQWIFPEEAKYKNREYARTGTKEFFDNLLASGTTTCQAFTTAFAVATEEFFEEASRRNMLVLGGLTGIDRFAPPDSMDTAEHFYNDSKRLIAKYHRKGRNLYAITPRFALGATPDLMKACQRLKEEHPDCWVNTHISENPSEIRGVKEYHECPDYLTVYEKYGLVGKKFSGGHGVWLSDDEFRRIARVDASVTFCPLSNLFLGSGLFRLGRATDPDHRVRLSFGTDMGGGNRFCMINVLDEAYKVGMVNNTLLDGSVDPRWEDREEAERNKLSPFRAFYSVTLGGAHGLYIDDRVGNFQPGKEADFVTLDWNVGQRAMVWHGSLLVGKKGPSTVEDAANLLFSIMVCGDDRNVDETWVMGQQAYKRPW
ncbi:MAG TPA: guanine deaminase [Candidatus Dormibacteraeota bacterium]|nr:guanine deaminase [Candidatus Dormibacteraeota bacterium]